MNGAVDEPGVGEFGAVPGAFAGHGKKARGKWLVPFNGKCSDVANHAPERVDAGIAG